MYLNLMVLIFVNLRVLLIKDQHNTNAKIVVKIGRLQIVAEIGSITPSSSFGLGD